MKSGTGKRAVKEPERIGGSCLKQGTIFLGSAIGTIASIGTGGFLVGLGLTLTVSAYSDYLSCQVGRMS